MEIHRINRKTSQSHSTRAGTGPVLRLVLVGMENVSVVAEDKIRDSCNDAFLVSTFN
jgi:hypothetical protein